MAMGQNERLTEAFWFPLTGVYTSLTTAQTGPTIDLMKSRKVAFEVAMATLAGSEVITFLIQGSTNGTTGWTTIANTTETVTKAQNTAGISQIVVETNAENVNAGNLANATTYRYIRYSVAGAIGSAVAVTTFVGAGVEEPQSSLNPASTSVFFV